MRPALAAWASTGYLLTALWYGSEAANCPSKVVQPRVKLCNPLAGCWPLLMQAQDSSGEEGGRRQEDAAGTGNRHVCALHACAQAALGQQGGGGESKGHSGLGSVQESVARHFSLETAKAPVPCVCHPLKPASLLPCCLHELQGKVCFPPSPMICTRACP